MITCPAIIIDISRQMLFYRFGGNWNSFPVSTAKNGAGEQNNSFQTPRGFMCIRAKIGQGAKPLAVFRGRRLTGECYLPKVADAKPRDWILGRILWLSGLEPHINRLGAVDTMRRYIYMHGTTPTTDMTIPNSMGCIRIQVEKLLPFFAAVRLGEKLVIVDSIDEPLLVVEKYRGAMESVQNINASERLLVSAYPPLSVLMQELDAKGLKPLAGKQLWRDKRGWQHGFVESLKGSDEIILKIEQTAARIIAEANITEAKRRKFNLIAH